MKNVNYVKCVFKVGVRCSFKIQTKNEKRRKVDTHRYTKMCNKIYENDWNEKRDSGAAKVMEYILRSDFGCNFLEKSSAYSSSKSFELYSGNLYCNTNLSPVFFAKFFSI